MKKVLLNSIFIICLLLSIHSSTFAQMSFEHSTWEEVKAKAKKEKKFIFVDAFTTWCGPCKWMSANVFPDKSVGEFYNQNYVNFKLDMEKGEGLDFAKTYQVNAYPTLIFFNTEGEMVYKVVGAAPTEKMLEVGKTAMNPDKQLPTLKKKFAQGERNPQFLQEYIAALQSAYEEEEATKVSEIYLKNLDKKEWLKPENWQMLSANPDANSELFKYVIAHKSDFEAQLGKEEINNFILKAYTPEVNQAIENQDESKLNALKAKFKEILGKDADGMLARLDFVFYSSGGDTQKAEKATDLYLNNYADNWNELNSIAWSYFESTTDKAKLEKASKWAEKSIKLNKNSYNTDTYANLLFKLGKNKEALTYAEESVKLGKTAGEDTQATEDLVKKIKASLK